MVRRESKVGSRRVARPPANVTGSSGPRSLLAKYQAAVRRYEALVRRYRALQRQRTKRRIQSTDVAIFAIAARRSPVTGLALIREDGIHARNLRYMALDRPKMGWRRVSDGSTFRTLDDAVSATAMPWRMDSRAALRCYERLDGERTIDVRVERIGGGQRLFMATVVDVTEAVRTAEELEAARRTSEEQERLRTIGELASGFAHDFNNTLHAMALWIARLGQTRSGADDVRALASLSRIVGDAALRVGQLQDFSRRRSDAPEESLSLREVIDHAVEICSGDMEPDPVRSRPGFTIETLVAPDLPLVQGSPTELRHVFVNLFLNARDAMTHGGRVFVSAKSADDVVIVAVEDEGNGIPEADLGRVFDPFFTTKGHRGTGLGLSIAHQVMQRLGGTITAENRAAGGAMFLLTFPAASNVHAMPGIGTSSRQHRDLRVLVVDDDADNLEAMRMVLEGLGQMVTVAASGPEALGRARHARFDVILCDVGMPDMNGWEVAEHMREIAPRTPIYMVTGWANEIASDDPHRRNVAGVIPKPLEMDTLVRLLGAADAPGSGARSRADVASTNAPGLGEEPDRGSPAGA